jgi:two-component system LytT family sensor kinase
MIARAVVIPSNETGPLTQPRMTRLARSAVFVVVAALLALAWAWQRHQIVRSSGDGGSFAFQFLKTSAAVLIWVLFTPALVRASNTFPLRWPNRTRNALVMSLVAVAVAWVRAAIDVTLGLTFHPSLSVATEFHPHLVVAAIVIGVANFIRLESDERSRRVEQARIEKESTEALLRQFRSDLNPHFLFNTLNAVATLLHRDPAAAEEMLDKLHGFMQKAFATEHAVEVRLADELEFVSQYFDIQRMRFIGRLTTLIDVSEPRLYDAAVPPLLLQPLIENSFVHGLAQRRDRGCVSVLVDEQRDHAGAFLRIQVRDNGPGCTNEALFVSGRVGVANAVARLQCLYGTRQSLTYEHRGDVFVAQVRLPLRIIAA